MSVRNYQKLDAREHCLVRPSMYVGSVSTTTDDRYCVDHSGGADCFIKENVEFNPALLKMFDEILTNSVDEYVKGNVTTIDVGYSVLTGEIQVADNGGIPVVSHPEYKMYIPEMVFGEFMSGSNFDDEERLGGGMNGLGAKLTAVFSKRFNVDTCDGKKRFIQTYTDNLATRSTPTVLAGSEKGTVISYIPDYDRLGVPVISVNDGNYRMMERRCYDVAGCNPGLKVTFNGDRIKFKNFAQYASMYVGDDAVFDNAECFSVVVGPSKEDGFEHVSFVNNIDTYNGGTHVDHIMTQIVNEIRSYIKKKHKIDVKPNNIKQQMTAVVSCSINAPMFTSQTKEYLSTPVSGYGKTYSPSPAFIKKILSSSIITHILDWVRGEQERQEQAELDKANKQISNGSGLKKIIKFEDATSRNRSECTLFLVEGDSAILPFAGRDSRKHGLYPLRGKPLNVKKVSAKKLAENKEFVEIMTILGLKIGKKFKPEDMRFGKICIASDQDNDGSHIAGLVLNMFWTFWPELVTSGCLHRLQTPLIKATVGKKEYEFYSKADYLEWCKKGTKHQYRFYKGLSEHTTKQFKKYLTDECMITLLPDGEGLDLMNMVFDKDSADRRKEWLKTGVENDDSI